MKNFKIQISNFKGIFQFIFLLLTFFTFNFGFAQFDIPEKPSFQTSVYDYANILSENEKTQLEEKLVHYSDTTTTQIVVITIENLKGEDIRILTPKWGHTWGIGGSEKNDNGVIILLAKDERKIWFSAGYGLEDRLTAGVGGEITRNIIIPEFKAGSYYNGLDKGTDALFDVFKGKYKGERKPDKEEGPHPLLILIIIFIAAALVSRNKKDGGGSYSRSGYSSGSSGSSSKGGFGGGFGGGGFSGSGSGGSW